MGLTSILMRRIYFSCSDEKMFGRSFVMLSISSGWRLFLYDYDEDNINKNDEDEDNDDREIQCSTRIVNLEYAMVQKYCFLRLNN